jgi:hypothetical protein
MNDPDPDRVKLLHGPYAPPPLARGDRATCLLRDCDVVITSWSDARIPWPRCRALGSRGGSGLLLAGDLARAVRTESAAALRYWWRASSTAVFNWRQALGVHGLGTEGSRRLRHALNEELAARLRDEPLPFEQVERLRAQAIRLNLGRNLKPGYHGPWWTPADLALLGTDTDEAIAAQIGRTACAVRIARAHRGIPSACDRRRRAHRGGPPP